MFVRYYHPNIIPQGLTLVPLGTGQLGVYPDPSSHRSGSTRQAPSCMPCPEDAAGNGARAAIPSERTKSLETRERKHIMALLLLLVIVMLLVVSLTLLLLCYSSSGYLLFIIHFL